MKFLIQQKQRETVHHFSRIPRTIRGEEINELRNDENGNESKKIGKMKRWKGRRERSRLANLLCLNPAKNLNPSDA